MTINNNSAEQINVALIDIERKNNKVNSSITELSNKIATLEKNLTTKQSGLQEGSTYNINISGSASSASTATTAGTATTAISANSADYATSAGTAGSATSATKDGSGNVITDTYQKKDWTSLYSNSTGTSSSITLSDTLSNYSEVCIAVKRTSDNAFWRAHTIPVSLLIAESSVFTAYGHMCEAWTDSYIYARYTSGTTLVLSGGTSCAVIAVYAR